MSDTDTFVTYFRNTLEAIRSLKVKPDPNSDRSDLFRRALYMGVVDALSKRYTRKDVIASDSLVSSETSPVGNTQKGSVSRILYGW